MAQATRNVAHYRVRYGKDWGRRRAFVLKRDGRICWICGGENANSVDHVIPLVRGGTHDYSNLRAAHLSCNVLRTSHLPRPARWGEKRKQREGMPRANIPTRWG